MPKQVLSSHSNVWVSDFETEGENFYKEHGYTKTWLTYTENLIDDKENFMSIDIMSLYKYILGHLRTQKKSQYIYYHNLTFDGTFWLYFLNELKELGIEYSTVINDTKKIYEIKVSPTKSKYSIVFRCTYLIFLTSVAKLPYSTKTTIDYKSIRNYKTLDEVTENEKHYIKQDVITVKKNMLELVFEHGIKLTGFFKTIGSISYKEMKKMTSETLKEKGLWWELLFPPIPLDLDKYIRKSFRGGYTYVNPKIQGKLLTVLTRSFDHVSGYPAVWRNKPLPVGIPKITTIAPRKGQLYLIRLQVLEATIKEGHHPFIATSQATRYLNQIYPTTLEECVLTLTSIDYEIFIKYYTGVWDILDYAIFPNKVTGAFNAYIDKWFAIKDTNKQMKKWLMTIVNRSEEQEEQLKRCIFNEMWAKLHLNSPYGKFGTNPLMRSATPVFDERGYLKWIITEDEKELNKYYLPVACFITAYVREKTITAVQESRDIYCYADTDSMTLLGTDIPESLDYGKELGQWDDEGISYKTKFIKPKQYLKLKKDEHGDLQVTRAIASMSKGEHQRVNFDNFYIGSVFKGGKKSSLNVLGGRIIRDLDFTFK